MEQSQQSKNNLTKLIRLMCKQMCDMLSSREYKVMQQETENN